MNRHNISISSLGYDMNTKMPTHYGLANEIIMNDSQMKKTGEINANIKNLTIESNWQNV